MKQVKDLTILVVDDEPDLGELVAFEFELVGAKVLSASNGRDALDIVHSNDRKIDVVVSDIRMPGGDGVELLDNLQKGVEPIPHLVFMTGFADISVEEAYDKGAVAMFGKPFNRNELIETVGNAVLSYEERWRNELTEQAEIDTISKSYPSISQAASDHSLCMGRGGLFLALEDALPAVTDRVRLNLSFSEGPVHTLSGEATVRWIRRQAEGSLPKGVGLELQSVVGASREELFTYLKEQHLRPYIPKG